MVGLCLGDFGHKPRGRGQLPGIMRRFFKRFFATVFCLPAICGWLGAVGVGLLMLAGRLSAEPVSNAGSTNGTHSAATLHFEVKRYVVKGSSLLTPEDLAGLFAVHTGTNVSLEEIVKAAGDLHREFFRLGYPLMSVAMAPDQITNGMVTLNVFQTAVPQVVVAGQAYLTFGEDASERSTAAVSQSAPWSGETNRGPVFKVRTTVATPAQVAAARAALPEKMTELAAQERDHRVHVPKASSTNFFAINNYLVEGNTILSPAQIALTLTNIDGAYGSQVTFDGIRTAAAELQKAYRDRGYVTVAVSIPPQTLSTNNPTLKLHVTEGRLVAINVTNLNGDHYFSSNNVMRALPSLHTNMILNGPIFQAEVNRANANQDRQIYPVIGPGPVVGTSELTLKVKDQLPLHGKVDLDNQSSPGTPALRVNASAMADNLWQLEHSLGVQYGFSPEAYKVGSQWEGYDQPLVANYSIYYRMPLGRLEAIDEVVTANPGSFGYDEATRKFNLPPASGRPELNLYASRSAIDTGVEVLSDDIIYNDPGVRLITKPQTQQGFTVNNTAGFRLSAPLPEVDGYHSSVSGGLDFKTYEAKNYKTNGFEYTQITLDSEGNRSVLVSSLSSPVPITDEQLYYLPISLRYDGSLNGPLGTTAFGFGLSANLWYSDSTTTNGFKQDEGLTTLQGITGSHKATGHWVTLMPSLTQVITFHTNWTMTVRADGQWTTEPLISNEQFGAGGINSVRGYREGEVFGDNGWHFSMEQQTPPHVIGLVRGGQALTIRGSVFMDYARVFLEDPLGRPQSTPLWGTGVGGIMSLGTHWDARFLCSFPLLDTTTTTAYQPFFNFALTTQF